LWDTENSTAVQIGTPNTSGTFGTITETITVAGTYQLQVNYDDTEGSVTQEAFVTNVTLTHSVIGTVFGAVTINDTFGTDGSVGVVGLNFINELNAADFAEVPAAGVVTVDTLLGSLTINALGQYTYTADTDAISGSGLDTDTITYTRKDGDGDTSSADAVFHIVDVALPGTLDATILTNPSGQAQSVYLTFVDVLQPVFSYAGLYDLDGLTSTFHRQVGWGIDAFQEYAVSLESTGNLVPLTGLTVEGITIHGQVGNEGTVGLELDNTNPTTLDQTALTAIIRPDQPTGPLQAETASFDGDERLNDLFDPTVTPGDGGGSGVNTVNYLYGAVGSDNLVGDNDTDVLNGGAGTDFLFGSDGSDILVYDPDDQKVDGGGGFDVLRIDQAALGLFNGVGVVTDAATGFSVVDVLAANPPIKDVEMILITDDAGSNPFEGARLALTAQDVLTIISGDNNVIKDNSTLYIVGNAGDVVDLDIGTNMNQWADRGLASDGFRTFGQIFDSVELTLKIENAVSVV
jgi:VCBS repeat-containing protein